MVATLLLFALLLMGMVPPFLDGLAVFASKHALAPAHASEGGKWRVWEKWPTASRSPEEATTWSCTEQFPSPCARQEQRSSARFGFLAGRGAQETAFAVVFDLCGGALREGWTSR
jgi:hypothetical protein